MLCPRCDTEIPEHFKFCLDCGLNLKNLSGNKGKAILAEVVANATQADRERNELTNALKKLAPAKKRGESEETITRQIQRDELDFQLANSSATEFIKREAFDFAARALQTYLSKHPGGQYQDVTKRLIEVDLPEGARMLELLRLHKEVREAFSGKDYLKAKQLSEAVLNRYPRMVAPSEPTLTLLGLEPKPGPQTAEDIWGATHQTMVALEEIEEKAEDLYQKGSAQLAEQNLTKAQQLFNLAEKTFPGLPKVREAIWNVEQTLLDQQSPLEKFRALLAKANRLVENKRLRSAREACDQLKRMYHSMSKSEDTAALFDFQRSCVEYEELETYLRERESELDQLSQRAAEALARRDYDGCLAASVEAGSITIEERGSEDSVNEAEAILQEIERGKAAAQSALSQRSFAKALGIANHILELSPTNEIARQLRATAERALAKRKRQKAILGTAAVFMLVGGVWAGRHAMQHARLAAFEQAVREHNSAEALRLAKLIGHHHRPAHDLLTGHAQATGMRSRMQNSRSAAEAVGADKFAPEMWREIAVLARSGSDAYASCRYPEATNHWSEASERFAAAAANTKSMRSNKQHKETYAKTLTAAVKAELDAYGGEKWQTLQDRVTKLENQQVQSGKSALGWADAAMTLRQLTRTAAYNRQVARFNEKMEQGRLALQATKHDTAAAAFAEAAALFKDERLAIKTERRWPFIRKAEMWEMVAAAYRARASKELPKALALVNQALLVDKEFDVALKLKSEIESTLSPNIQLITRFEDAEVQGAHVIVNDKPHSGKTPTSVRLKAEEVHKLVIIMPGQNNRRFVRITRHYRPQAGHDDTLLFELELAQKATPPKRQIAARPPKTTPTEPKRVTTATSLPKGISKPSKSPGPPQSTDWLGDYRKHFPGIEEGSLSWGFIKHIAERMAADAERLALRAQRSRNARRKGARKGGHVNVRLERRHEWLTNMSTLLLEMSEHRRVIQQAKFRNPLLPPIDTSVAQREYDSLLAKVQEIRAQASKKKGRKVGS